MIGASIYGFVDYKKSSHKIEFNNMYSEEKLKSSVVPDNIQSTEADFKTEAENIKINAVSKQQVVNKQNVSVAVNPITDDNNLKANDTGEMKNTYVSGTPSKQKNLFRKTKKNKIINVRLFSRAPLRDEDEDLPPSPPVKSKKN